jgi:hypothetical protein
MKIRTMRARGKRKISAAGILILVSLVAAPATMATTLVRMDVDELTRSAAVVARARCLGSSSRWEDGHLWTLTTFAVAEVWKSTAPRTIVVRLVGGADGQRTVLVDGVPRFRAGEEVVLFLEPTAKGEMTVTSWGQGTFRIRRDPGTREESVTQDTSGMSMFDPATRQLRAGGVRRMEMGQFRARVLHAAAGARQSVPRETER